MVIVFLQQNIAKEQAMRVLIEISANQRISKDEIKSLFPEAREFTGGLGSFDFIIDYRPREEVVVILNDLRKKYSINWFRTDYSGYV